MNIGSRIKRLSQVDLNSVGVGVVVGLLVGAVVGGIGARIAMRIVALVASMQPSFTLGGTTGILVIGAILGMPFGLIYVAIRRYLPGRGLWNGLVYGALLWLIFVVPTFLLAGEGELALVSPAAGIAIFMSVPLLYGMVLAVLLARVEARLLTAEPRRISTGWFIVFGVFLMLTVVGVFSLADTRLSVPDAFHAVFKALGISSTRGNTLLALLEVAFLFGYCSLATAIFWRGAYTWMAQFAALTLVAFSAGFFNDGKVFAPSMDTIFIVRWIPGLMKTFGLGTLLGLIYRFPDGRLEPRWTRWLTITWIGFLLIWFLDLFTVPVLDPDVWPEAVLFFVVIGILVSGLIAQLVRFRRVTDTRTRQQIRLFLFGVAGAILIFGLLWLIVMLSPGLQPWNLSAFESLFAFGIYILPWLLIPISIVYSMERYRLWTGA